MKPITILIAMNLAGQAGKRRQHAIAQDGYAMAALIVAMGIMALMMTVVMPVWKQAARREKEEELVFRGMQYVHAIGLYQRKFANAYPPNLDLLVDRKFLRKKFKDPITNDDFVILPPGTALPGAPVPGGQRGGTQPAGGIGSRGIGSGDRKKLRLDSASSELLLDGFEFLLRRTLALARDVGEARREL